MADDHIIFKIESKLEDVEVTPETIGMRRLFRLLATFEDAVDSDPDPTFSGRAPFALTSIEEGCCIARLKPSEHGKRRSERILGALADGDGSELSPEELKALRKLNKAAKDMGLNVRISSQDTGANAMFDGRRKIAPPSASAILELTSVVGTYAGQSVGEKTVKLKQLGGGIITLKSLAEERLVWFSQRHGAKPNQRFRATGKGAYDHRKVLTQLHVTDVDIVRGLDRSFLRALSAANESVDASEFLREG